MTPHPAQLAAVAYPGPDGSHSGAAAAALFPSSTLRPVSGFRGVADAVASGEAAYGVLPIESSVAGPVAETHDLLYERALSIVAETVQPIRHCLAAAGPGPLARIRVVRSHPSAFEQCRRALAGLTLVAAATTADAARLVARSGSGFEAAVASRAAAERYGLTVVADDIGDHPAFTRFVTIASHSLVDVNDARTALAFVTDHRPGALYRAIEPLAEAAIDLERLVSRPQPESPFRYRFDAVIAGHPRDPCVRAALVGMRRATRELRVLGVYTAAGDRPATLSG